MDDSNSRQSRLKCVHAIVVDTASERLKKKKEKVEEMLLESDFNKRLLENNSNYVYSDIEDLVDDFMNEILGHQLKV